MPSPEELYQLFVSKVQKSPDPDGCWIWTGYTNDSGYGIFTFGGRAQRTRVRAHVWHYEHVIGPLQPKIELHHRLICLNKRCVRIDHLEPLTEFEHKSLHGFMQTRPIVCVNGHSYVGDNIGTCVRSNGKVQRYCKQCKADYESTEEYKEKYRAIDAKRREKSRSSPEFREERKLYMRERRAKEKADSLKKSAF